MSCAEEYGFIDLDELFPDATPVDTLSFDQFEYKPGDSGSSDDGISNTSPIYSPTQSQSSSSCTPPHNNNISPKDLTLESLLDNPMDTYTNKFVENIMGETRTIPKPTYRAVDPIRPVVNTRPVSKRVSPYSMPPKRASIEDVSYVPTTTTMPLEKRLRKTPVKEQKIHATDKCQIVKIEPETCESLSLETQEMLGVTGNGVFVKVEPQVAINSPKTSYNHNVKVPEMVVGNGRDLLSQAMCHAIGMDSRGQIYKRTDAQIRAEQRKIKNRESASISRERKKRHLEETELRNKDLANENTRLRKKNKDLEEQIRKLQNELERATAMRSVGNRRIVVSSTALLSIAIVGFLTYPQIPLHNVYKRDVPTTQLSFPSPTGRKLMSVNEMTYTDLTENDLTDFWLDDVLHELRNNKGFTQILKLVQNGPIDIRRTVQRKLYEEFKISFRELRRSYPLKFPRSRGPPIGIESAQDRSTGRPRLPPKSPKLENQMCEPKVDGKEIHRMFDSWRSAPTPSKTVENLTASNETGLIPGNPTPPTPEMWTQAELLRSLGPSLKNNSYYVVSHTHLPIIAPMMQDNTSNPKMTFGK
jgi:hypothetical protein